MHPKGQGRERLAYNSSLLVCFFSRSTTDKRDYKPHPLSWGLFDYLLRPLKCLIIIIKGTLHAWMTQSFTPPPSKSWLGYKKQTRHFLQFMVSCELIVFHNKNLTVHLHQRFSLLFFYFWSIGNCHRPDAFTLKLSRIPAACNFSLPDGCRFICDGLLHAEIV